jgi:hypothetical protein
LLFFLLLLFVVSAAFDMSVYAKPKLKPKAKRSPMPVYVPPIVMPHVVVKSEFVPPTRLPDAPVPSQADLRPVYVAASSVPNASSVSQARKYANMATEVANYLHNEHVACSTASMSNENKQLPPTRPNNNVSNNGDLITFAGLPNDTDADDFFAFPAPPAMAEPALTTHKLAVPPFLPPPPPALPVLQQAQATKALNEVAPARPGRSEMLSQIANFSAQLKPVARRSAADKAVEDDNSLASVLSKRLSKLRKNVADDTDDLNEDELQDFGNGIANRVKSDIHKVRRDKLNTDHFGINKYGLLERKDDGVSETQYERGEPETGFATDLPGWEVEAKSLPPHLRKRNKRTANKITATKSRATNRKATQHTVNKRTGRRSAAAQKTKNIPKQRKLTRYMKVRKNQQ